eukprot:CAMPEP_0184296980 /NCGR_PEP_ID=MMETSP1049-20130417/7926_1 /TAXON_ID=77928 /ORGANISM="Proteomonas sulcata, Strain CCMP704" /LENGTH=70 /DNA_ID=CAMNT_0026606489 /DNA_START=22 /DNA_END=234 /DNA_ORIENTATION=-
MSKSEFPGQGVSKFADMGLSGDAQGPRAASEKPALLGHRKIGWAGGMTGQVAEGLNMSRIERQARRAVSS